MSLAADLRRAVDPAELAPAIGMDPDPWQVDLLRSSQPRILANCARQSGKSTTTSLVAVWRAVYVPGSTVLCVSPSQRQSSELFKKVVHAYRKLGRPVAAEQESATSLTLENGSRVLSLPGTEATVRGLTASLMLIDESSRVEDELYAALRPMLAVSHGQLIAMSTPHGRRGWWADAWHDGGPGWERICVTADDCPRISAEFLAEELATLGRWRFQQEYEGKFVAADSAVFSADDIAAAFEREAAVPPLFRNIDNGGV